MTCEEVRLKLSWYIDDELDPREADAVRLHLHEGCGECRARLEEMSLLDGEVRRAVKGIRPPAAFARKVILKVRRPASPWLKRVGLAAAALLVLVGGAALYVNTRKAPSLEVVVHGGESFHADCLGALRILVGDAVTQLPVGQANVRVLLAGKEVGRYLTGAAGTIDGSFRVPDLKDGAYPLEVQVESPLGNETLSRTVTVHREYRLMLSTDKPMYQPGQTILMRALALNAFTLKPHWGDAEFEVLDSKGNRIFTKKTKLSEFGIVSAELPLADEINLGTYRVGITASGLKQERTVEVAKYVLPKFKVELELEKPSARPGETIRGKVKASYFFGKQVAGRVKAAIGRELVSGDLRPDGTWEFQASAPEAEGLAPVEVTVTDTADHRESKSSGVTVSREPLKVVLYPEGGMYLLGVKRNNYYVLVSYPDGRPAKADVTFTLWGQTSDIATDDLGVAKITAGELSELRIDRVRDRAGNETRAVQVIPGAGATEFSIRLDKTSYRAGETMTIQRIGEPRGPVYVDVVKGGQLLLAKAMEGKDLAVDLPPDLFGTVQVMAYTRSSQPVTRVAVVGLPEGLRIRPRVSKETFRPGEEMLVELEVIDKAGKPIQAALGISVVDEALFGLVESKIASEKAWLSLAPELIDTRGFLKADAAEIYQRTNPNAQGFVGGNGVGARLQAILNNDYPAKARAIELSAERFNRAVAILGHWVIFLGACAAVILTLGVPLVRGLKFVVWTKKTGLIGFLVLTAAVLGMPGGVEGILVLTLATGFTTMAGYAAQWWLRRYHTLPGLLALILVFVPVFVLLFSDGSGPLGETRESKSYSPASGDEEVVRKSWFDLYKSDWSPPSVAQIWRALGGDRREMHYMAIEDSAVMVMTRSSEAMMQERFSSPLDPKPESPRERAHVRELFPETLYWKPELITNEKGHAWVTLPPADSITSWRMLASAVSRNGALGFEQASLRVFQDFFVDIDFPVALTKGDRVHVPVAVYNYLKEPQTVVVRAQKEPWFELLDEERKSISLKPGEVSVVYFGLRAKEHGRKTLTIFSDGNVQDAIRRSVEVMEKGREVPITASERILGRHAFKVEIPERSIDGATVLFARLTPGVGDLLTSLQGMIRMPYG